MAKALDFGVQSYCFREFKDNADVARKVREIGLDKIELCRIHADFHDLESWKKVLATYKNEGVEVISLGVEAFHGLENERDLFECAALGGFSHISGTFRVDTYTKAIPWVRKLSQEYGVKVGIHNHGGYDFAGNTEVLKHLIGLGTPEIGLCIDTAWAMQIGPRPGNPVAWAKEFAGHITGVHYKDFLFDKHGQWEDTIVGQGTLQLKDFVAALEAGGFDGMAVIEYEADPENPVPALKACVDAMRSMTA
ncbi:MAG: sugar phosphate isomerase/epimerase [Trueperaceae bacterium]|nr:sugar phosphate isomerase/epimerase [Trueperaceae bacterium]